MKKVVWCSLGLVCLAFLIGGCSKGVNIFGWTSPTGGSAQASVANGDAQFAANDYANAMASYDAAISADPKNSKARYGYVKAYLKNIRLDLAAFLKNYSNENSAPSFVIPAVSVKVNSSECSYDLIDDPTRPFGTNLQKFQILVEVIINYLDPIARGECDEVIPRTNVGLNVNLAFAHLLRGIFCVLDEDYNGSLNYNIRKNCDGTVNIIRLSDGHEMADTDSIPNKDAALWYIDRAICRLTTAIGNGVPNAPLWRQIRDLLEQVQIEVANHS
ncbi:MAG: tetratricopeptide repeat protein [Candidatus Firestonebacteria bacterium]